MTSEVTVHQQHQSDGNKMLAEMAAKAGLPASINAGSVAIEQERAIAEARGQMQLAKMFPRDLTKAHSELMSACKSKAFAGAAFYSVPRAGGSVTGPSIRLAEEIARVVGNFQYGHRELSRDDRKSEVEVFAWDVENNNRSVRQLTVMHVIDTRQGPKPCRDQKDIDDKISNVASKQVRGRILALIPKWLLEDAILECKKTLTGTNDEPLEVRIRKMTQAFGKYGVTTQHLETYLGHKLDSTMVDELVDLQGVFNALKEGAKPSDYFGAKDDDSDAGNADDKAAETIKAAAKSGAKKQSSTAKKSEQTATKAADPEPEKAESAAKTSQDSKVDQKDGKNVQAEEDQTQTESTASNSEKPNSDDEGDLF